MSESTCSNDDGLSTMKGIGSAGETFLTMRTRAFANYHVPSFPAFESSRPRSKTNLKRQKVREDEQLPTSSKKRPRSSGAKTVRFAEGPELTRDIPYDSTEEEIEDSWYCRRDYQEFQEDTQSTALAFDLGIVDHIAPEEVCLRGLEAHLSSKLLEARVSGRQAMITLILRTQEVQRCHDMHDEEFIRGLSIMLSRCTRENALKLAAFDATEAKEAFAELDDGSNDRGRRNEE